MSLDRETRVEKKLGLQRNPHRKKATSRARETRAEDQDLDRNLRLQKNRVAHELLEAQLDKGSLKLDH